MISRKKMEEMKLEMENFHNEQVMEVLQYNSKFHAREGKLSTLPLEISQTSKPYFSLSSLSEKQYNINVIPRVILGEESSNLLHEIFWETVERDEKEHEEELVCKGIPQLDYYKVPIPFPEALYSKSMLNSMNLEREDKILVREMGEIIYDIHMLFVDVESIVLDDKIDEVYEDQQYKGGKSFIKVINCLMCLMRI